ncbi:hypothetical protein PR048_010320, partial [Dryococelus australis]
MRHSASPVGRWVATVPLTGVTAVAGEFVCYMVAYVQALATFRSTDFRLRVMQLVVQAVDHEAVTRLQNFVNVFRFVPRCEDMARYNTQHETGKGNSQRLEKRVKLNVFVRPLRETQRSFFIHYQPGRRSEISRSTGGDATEYNVGGETGAPGEIAQSYCWGRNLGSENDDEKEKDQGYRGTNTSPLLKTIAKKACKKGGANIIKIGKIWINLTVTGVERVWGVIPLFVQQGLIKKLIPTCEGEMGVDVGCEYRNSWFTQKSLFEEYKRLPFRVIAYHSKWALLRQTEYTYRMQMMQTYAADSSVPANPIVFAQLQQTSTSLRFPAGWAFRSITPNPFSPVEMKAKVSAVGLGNRRTPGTGPLGWAFGDHYFGPFWNGIEEEGISLPIQSGHNKNFPLAHIARRQFAWSPVGVALMALQLMLLARSFSKRRDGDNTASKIVLRSPFQQRARLVSVGMAITQHQKSFCDLRFNKCESVMTVQLWHCASYCAEHTTVARAVSNMPSIGGPRVPERDVERIRQSFVRSPHKSSRELAISHMTVWLLQALRDVDKQRLEFCEFILGMEIDNVNFCSRFVFREETIRRVHCHKVRVWGTQRPDAMVKHEERFFFLWKTPLWERYIWICWRSGCFHNSENDVASPHWQPHFRKFPNIKLPERWIGCKGLIDRAPHQWPPRSPDLSVCDFFSCRGRGGCERLRLCASPSNYCRRTATLHINSSGCGSTSHART